MEKENKKSKQKGVLLAAYVPLHVKEFLARQAKIQHKPVSHILREILVKEIAVSFVEEKITNLKKKDFSKRAWFVQSNLSS